MVNNFLGGAGSILDIPLTEAQTNQISFNRLADIVNSNLRVKAFNELGLTTPRFTKLVSQLVQPFELPGFGIFSGEQKFAEALKARRQSYQSIMQEIAGEIERGFKTPQETTVKRIDEAKALYEEMLPGYVALNQLTSAMSQAKFDEKVSQDPAYRQNTSNWFERNILGGN